MNEISAEQAMSWIRATELELEEDEQAGLLSPEAATPERATAAEQLMSELKACGWFRGYPENAIGVIGRQLRLRWSLRTLWFDAELLNAGSEEDYRGVFQKFSRGSFGVFTPEELEFSKGTQPHSLHCAFKAGGRRFETDIDRSTDWFDERVFKVINEAMAAIHPFLRFIKFPATDQTGQYAIVDYKASEDAIRRGLIQRLIDV